MHGCNAESRRSNWKTLRPRSESTLNARASLAVLVSTYIVLLLWNYRVVLAPQFGYYGLIYEPPSLGFAAFTFLCAILPVCWLPVRQWRPSMILGYSLYLVVYIPACIVPAYNASVPLKTAAELQISLLAAFAILCLGYMVPTGRMRRLPLATSHFWGAVALYCFVVMALMYATFGFSLTIHSFDDVYDVRGIHQDVAAKQSRILIYLLVWQANVVAPLLFAMGWVSRRVVLIVIGGVIEVWLFSRTGYKHFVLAVPVLLAVLAALKGFQCPVIVRRLCWGLVAAVGACSVMDWLTGGFVLSSLVVRRGIITPGLLTYYYYDYYSLHPKALLGHSILNGLFGSSETLAPPFLIAQEYYHNVNASANANIWADGFANFGLAGMCLASILLAAFCWLYDSTACGADVRVSTALLVIPAISLSNSAILTAFLSHGLGLALLIVFFMPLRATNNLMRQRMTPHAPHLFSRGAIQRRPLSPSEIGGRK